MIIFFWFQRDQVTFEQFRLWIFQHPGATIITKWLLMEDITISLSNDTDTPTFYQTLAGVTHCKFQHHGNHIFQNFCIFGRKPFTAKFEISSTQLHKYFTVQSYAGLKVLNSIKWKIMYFWKLNLWFTCSHEINENWYLRK